MLIYSGVETIWLEFALLAGEAAAIPETAGISIVLFAASLVGAVESAFAIGFGFFVVVDGINRIRGHAIKW